MMRKRAFNSIVCLDDKGRRPLFGHLQGPLCHQIELNLIAACINGVGSANKPQALQGSSVGIIACHLTIGAQNLHGQFTQCASPIGPSVLADAAGPGRRVVATSSQGMVAKRLKSQDGFGQALSNGGLFDSAIVLGHLNQGA